MSTTITGRTAILVAAHLGVALRKHADPTEESISLGCLTAEEARRICAEDPSLVYVDSAEVAGAVPLSALLGLRHAAAEHGDTAQRILCDMAIDGEDSQYDADCLDADGRPDYSGGGHTASELTAIRSALRMTQDEARVECVRALAEGWAQEDRP